MVRKDRTARAARALLLCAGLLVCAAPAAHATTGTVEVSTTDELLAAVQAANDGTGPTDILVDPGTYSEARLIISASMTLRGKDDGSGQPAFLDAYHDPDNTDTNSISIQNHGSAHTPTDVTIDGLELANADVRGIDNSSSGTVTLSNDFLLDEGTGVATGGNGGTLDIVNTTIYGSGTGRQFQDGIGLQIYGGTVNVTNSDIAGSVNAGVQVQSADAVGGVHFTNSILAGNGVECNAPSDIAADASISQGGCGSGGWRNQDPKLANPALNGGRVPTMAEKAGSPAIDTADGGACPATDARGVPRPQGAGCDIGAYELAAGMTQIALTVHSPEKAGQPFTVRAVAENADGSTATDYNGPATWSDTSGTITPAAPADFVNGVSVTSATVPGAFHADRITITSNGVTGQSAKFDVLGPIDHVKVVGPSAPVDQGQSFTVQATAKDAANNTLTAYSGAVTWSDTTGSLEPSAPSSFSHGVSTTTADVASGPSDGDVITVDTGGASGTSAPFTVRGPLDHFVFSPKVPTPVSAGAAFKVRVMAVDALGNQLVNYTAPATWSDLTGTLTPAAPSDFVGGVSKTTTAQVSTPMQGDRITISSGGVSSTSNAFNVR